MYQDEQGPPFHTGIKNATTLAHRLEFLVTMENICRLATGCQIQGPALVSATVCLPSPLLPLSFSNIFVSFSTIMLGSLLPSLAPGLSQFMSQTHQPTYELEPDSPPLAKCSQCAHQNQIMALPTNHWNENDLINIYDLEAVDGDDGFARMCLLVFFPLFTPHDPFMAVLASTASSHINICGSI